MADTYVNTQGFSPVDTRQLMRQADAFSRSHDVVGDAGFNKALGIAQDVMSLAGPAIGAATPYMGRMGAAVATAAISGVAGSNGQIFAPGLNTSPTSNFASYGGAGKMLSMPGTAPGYPGAGGASGMPGTAPGFPGGGGAPGMNPMGGQDVSQFDSQINSMMNNNLTFLALQTKVQNVSQVSQMMSNIAKTDSDAKLNAIRNVRS
ncbi:MAG: hypothetical protein U1F66_12465 [bacterium]